MHPEGRTAIVMRLRSAEGHLGAVIDLLEAGEAPCEQVLHQLGAVRAALRVAGELASGDRLYSGNAIATSTPTTSSRINRSCVCLLPKTHPPP